MNKYTPLIGRLPEYLAQSAPPQHWADLGCGSGVFTEALADMLPAKSTIIAIDKTHQRLAANMGNDVSVSFQKADFLEDDLRLPELDGILMANALHFVPDKEALIRQLEKHLAQPKNWLIVEYDHRQPSRWVPYPIGFVSLKKMFEKIGYTKTEKIGEQASMYGGEIYAAIITN